jgi:hypothetical protein
MPSGGLGTRLDPALKAKNSWSRKVSFTKRLLKPFGAFNRKRNDFLQLEVEMRSTALRTRLKGIPA